MGVHIYCIVAHGRQPATDVTGVAGASVAAAHSSQLGVWYSEHASFPATDVSAIRAHHAVILSAMTPEFTPVPVRFGQWFVDPLAALEKVNEDESKWLEHLTRFAGCSEYGVRIDSDTVADTARDVHPIGGTGTAYMAALVRRHADAQRRRAEGEAIAMRVQGALTDVVLAVRIEFPTAGLVSLAHLVARRREVDYHAVLDEVRRSRSDLRFRVSGPWPPYSFVE